MGPGATRDLVISLRVRRDERGLSIGDIMALLKENSEKNGTALPSESTVRSVLNGDLERIGGFSYDATLMPLKQILLPPEMSEESITKTDVEGLLAVIRIQEETIKNLTRQLETARDAYEREKRETASLQKQRCDKCEKDIAFYKSQIAIKDKRMERKDKWIAELLKLPLAEDEETGIVTYPG